MINAFILTDPQGQIKDRDMLDLYDGYLELAFNVKMFNESEYYTHPDMITKDDIFCGHVNLCRAMMKHAGIKEPDVPNYPQELAAYFGRRIREMDLHQFFNILRENKNFGKTYFVKPKTNKLFTGLCVLTLQEFKQKVPQSISGIAKVYVSDEVFFDAEFRVYVYENEVVDCHRYWGDNWKVSTPSNDITNMVNLLKNMPIFYSLDVGINKEGKTLLVEVNDGYALGNYGLSPKDYAKMSADRWLEIMKS